MGKVKTCVGCKASKINSSGRFSCELGFLSENNSPLEACTKTTIYLDYIEQMQDYLKNVYNKREGKNEKTL